MDIVLLEWYEEYKCWTQKTEDVVIYLHRGPANKHLVTVEDVRNEVWTSQPCGSMWEALNIIQTRTKATPKFSDPNIKWRSEPMLELLKIAWNTLKITLARYKTTQATHDTVLAEINAKLVTLKQENTVLIAEQQEAIKIIEEMTQYMEKN